MIPGICTVVFAVINITLLSGSLANSAAICLNWAGKFLCINKIIIPSSLVDNSKMFKLFTLVFLSDINRVRAEEKLSFAI